VTTTEARGGSTNPPPSCIPNNAICRAAYQHASEHLHPSILNHSLRVFLYAQHISLAERTSYSTPSRLENTLLLVTALFHDIGTCSLYDTGSTRFEIDGGDAATKFLSRHPEIPVEWYHHVWTAIAVHTSPQIAERIHPLARLLRLAVKIDFGGGEENAFLATLLSGTADAVIAETQGMFPRAEIEKVLGDAVVDQALKRSEKAPMVSWPGMLLKSFLENPAWDGVNMAF
jgi:hypothetical protein